jgi:preprotein translocase subunit SecE
MADEIKTNREERENDRNVSGFSLMEPAGKLGAYPKRLRNFLHETRIEMRQVNWPSRLDVWSTTIVVTVTVAFFGVFFWVTDLVFSRLYVVVNGYFRKL